MPLIRHSSLFIVSSRLRIEFWNLQPDDEHDFALLSPDLTVLMYVQLPPLQKTPYIFTFHQEGELNFQVPPPISLKMNGQTLCCHL